MRYLIGNWKSYQTISQTQTWLTDFSNAKPKISNRIKLILCAPFTDLAEAKRIIHHYGLQIEVAAQDVSPFEEGKHTGEINAKMLSELTTYCLVGHSERRREFNETSEIVAEKVTRLIEANLSPIICLDTPYLEEQIKLLLHKRIPLERCLFVYEPLAAIGSGQPADPFEVEMIAQKISFLTESRCPILYGGSVTPENVASYARHHCVDGILVGGESLNPAHFVQMMDNLSYES